MQDITKQEAGARDRGDRITRRLANQDLRCKNKCGFYGNPIYRGYCSKCFKEQQQQQQQQQQLPSAERQLMYPSSEVGDPSGSASLFNRFNMKKRMQQTAKGGRLLKGSPLKNNTAAKEGSRPSGTLKKQPSVRSVEHFHEFLKTLRKPAAEDIITNLKMFKKHLQEKIASSTVEELGEAIQEFYSTIGDRLQNHVLFRSLNEEQQDDLMDCIEKHIMTDLYHRVFKMASSDDEMKDLLLVRRIGKLNWLGPTHLEINLDLQNPEVQVQISRGREELWAMDSKRAPQDKLHCISKCSTHLMSALRHSQDGPASADEFLPALIFLVIHSTPTHLHSNINYISRFSNPMRLMSGEAGYYFTNLCGAVSFLENISADVLSMTEDSFNDAMGYVGGKTDADQLIEETDEGDQGREKMHVLQSCCQGLKELGSHLQLMLVEARELEAKMDEFKSGLSEQVASILATPLEPLQSSASGDLIDFTGDS